MFFRKGKKRKKVGLALGSGNSRGLAHIGVIKVFEKEGIPIDMIAGTSVGALVGAMYAASKDIGDIERIALSTNKRQVFDFLYDPSIVGGLIKGNKIEKFIKDCLDDLQFSDLKIPLHAVATNLLTGEKVVMERGKLTEAIRASISIPVVLEPVRRSGHLLVDGGLAEPVPVETLKKMGADITVAVNLDSPHCLDIEGAASLSIKKVLECTMSITRNHLARECIKNADVLIEPKFANQSILGWDQYYKDAIGMIGAGENAANKAVPVIKKLL